MKKQSSEEMHSVGPDGKSYDHHIHEPILARGDSERSLEPARNAARRAGLSEEAIRKYYPPATK